MDKKYIIALAIAIVAALLINGLILKPDMFSSGITLALIIAFIIIILLPVNPLKRSSENKTETIEVDTEATTDSRICEKITGFMGVPFILVFGSMWRKYESIFSVKYGGENIVVLHKGICLVSQNDKLRITGEWYKGEKIGIEKNVVVAHRVENMNSGIIFDIAK